MKRRDFSLAAAGLTALHLPLLANAQTKAAAKTAQTPAAAPAPKPPVEGTDYLSLDKRIPTEVGTGKVEVIEFFWYNCPHCNAFEPAFEAWVKAVPKDVVVKRVPVRFRDDFEPQQRMYYVLEALNLIDKLHVKMFNAIHMEHQKLNSFEDLSAWAQANGIPAQKFADTFNSFGVAAKAKRAYQLQEQFKVQGVPALGIAGRFYSDGGLAGNMERVLQVTDYLINEVRKGR
jgi:thiol:disulfide interchange protein DsbA